MNIQKIVPHLWFDKEAKKAAQFYTSVFDNSKINFINIIPDTPSGDAEIVGFQITGYDFMAISAGPYFRINPSISFHVRCRMVEEVDLIWDKLSAVPEAEQCGWIKDKFGVSWQITPANMGELLGKNPEKTTPVMLQMKKIIIADLIKAGEK